MCLNSIVKILNSIIMRLRPFIYKLIRFIFENNGVLINEEYSVGSYQRANSDRSYAVFTKTGDIVFENPNPTPAIAYFVDLVGERATAKAIDLYIDKN